MPDVFSSLIPSEIMKKTTFVLCNPLSPFLAPAALPSHPIYNTVSNVLIPSLLLSVKIWVQGRVWYTHFMWTLPDHSLSPVPSFSVSHTYIHEYACFLPTFHSSLRVISLLVFNSIYKWVRNYLNYFHFATWKSLKIDNPAHNHIIM